MAFSRTDTPWEGGLSWIVVFFIVRAGASFVSLVCSSIHTRRLHKDSSASGYLGECLKFKIWSYLVAIFLPLFSFAHGIVDCTLWTRDGGAMLDPTYVLASSIVLSFQWGILLWTWVRMHPKSEEGAKLESDEHGLGFFKIGAGFTVFFVYVIALVFAAVACRRV